MELNKPITWELARNYLATGVAKEVKYYNGFAPNTYRLIDDKFYEDCAQTYRQPNYPRQDFKVVL